MGSGGGVRPVVYGERLRGAGELGEHEHASVLLLARDVFERDEVHAVAQRGDEHDLRAEVERAQLLLRVRVRVRVRVRLEVRVRGQG